MVVVNVEEVVLDKAVAASEGRMEEWFEGADIADLENSDVSLEAIASVAFDCALVVEFVAFDVASATAFEFEFEEFAAPDSKD